MVRCARCDAAWVARAADRAGEETRLPPLVARPPLIVESRHVPAQSAAPTRRWFAAWRAGVMMVLAIVALALAGAVLATRDVSARPDTAMSIGAH